MKIALISPESIKAVKEFADACELFLEKEKFSFKLPWENWHDMDDDHADKIKIESIKKRLSREENIHIDDLDERILAYEYLKSKYAHRLKHAILTMEVLLENVQDPTVTYLDFHPSFYQNHVAPEQ